MSTYKLRFFFEWGGYCLWSANDEARNKYGYPIEPSKLPLSKETLEKIKNMESWYQTALDWNDPGGPSPWTREENEKFGREAKTLLEKIISELGEDYEIIDKMNYLKR